MHDLLSNVSIGVNDKIYLKDPETSELGRKIVTCSIDLIDELGFEAFTFRKLGIAIDSNEASVYRYFESKHKLLLYLTSWYWSWMEYRLAFALANIKPPLNRLDRAIGLFTGEVKVDSSFVHINKVRLHRIVIAESLKTYMTKEVDVENKAGVFKGYKELVAAVSDIILEINPKYKYPHMLVSTLIEGAHLQRYFAEHLPGLTNTLKGRDAVSEFYKDLVFKTLKD